MRSSRRLVLCLLAAAALVAPPTASAGATATELFGFVGPGFSIGLRDAGGRAVTQLDPGAYRITVEDRSDFHNFRLSGPGVNLATGVDDVGTVVWEVTLAEGRYVFQCDPHRNDLTGGFTVGSPPPPPAPGRLVATVSTGSISLTSAGRRVTRLAPGTYVITVRDRSRVRNFRLLGPGVNLRTGVARTGTFTWRVVLRPGTYVFRSDRQSRRLRGSFRVG
jgi:hypothetical protein